MRAEYHIVGRGQLSQTGKNLLDAMTVRVGVQVRHRIHDKCHVVAIDRRRLALATESRAS